MAKQIYPEIEYAYVTGIIIRPNVPVNDSKTVTQESGQVDENGDPIMETVRVGITSYETIISVKFELLDVDKNQVVPEVSRSGVGFVKKEVPATLLEMVADVGTAVDSIVTAAKFELSGYTE
jgi:hypothetical protein